MFGLATFAGSAFATIGPQFYPFSIAEDLGIADSSTQQFAALLSQTEVFSMTDNNSGAGLFVTSLNENLTSDTVLLIGSSINTSFTDGLTSGDTDLVSAQFASSLTENSNLTDTSAVYFAALDSITEPISSVQDINTQQSTFGQTITENANLADSSTQQSAFKQSTTSGRNPAGGTTPGGTRKMPESGSWWTRARSRR